LKDDFLLVPSLLYLSIIEQLLTGCPLQLEMLEKLENEPFSECGWNSWETIGFLLLWLKSWNFIFRPSNN